MPLNKRVVWAIVRTIVSVLLLVALLWRARLPEVFHLMREASLLPIVVALFSYVGIVLVSCSRWQALLAVQGLHSSYRHLLAIYFVGLFFNNFLPAAVGGDLVRAYYVGREKETMAPAIASVIAERLFGLVGLLLFALMALLFYMGHVQGRILFLAILLAEVVVVVAMFLAVRQSLFLGFKKRVFSISILKAGERLQRLYDSIVVYGSAPAATRWAVITSIGVQALMVLGNILVGKGLGFQVVPFYYLAFIPVIGIVSMIPISINGLGVREGSYVALFAGAGLTAPEALSLSLLYFILGVIASLTGGVLFPFMGRVLSTDLSRQPEEV
jgi:uncharacterized protein (TIRG00374 family)